MAEVTPRRRLVKINAILQARLVKLLLDDEYSCKELAEETGLHYVTVLQYTRELHRAGAAHIARYEKDSRGRDSIKVYRLGAGQDAKRDKLTAAQRQQRARKRRLLAILLGLTHEVPPLQQGQQDQCPGVQTP